MLMVHGLHKTKVNIFMTDINFSCFCVFWELNFVLQKKAKKVINSFFFLLSKQDDIISTTSLLNSLFTHSYPALKVDQSKDDCSHG